MRGAVARAGERLAAIEVEPRSLRRSALIATAVVLMLLLMLTLSLVLGFFVGVLFGTSSETRTDSSLRR